MESIGAREKNLFNATDTMAQFYDEIETFLYILFGHMERAGYSAKAERLRSGTFTIKNLSRRLLATATVIYVKGIGHTDDALDDDENDEEEADVVKASKKELPITNDWRMPFVHLSLFPPKTIPSVRTLSSPTVILGAVSDMTFFEKKTGKPALPESPVLSLSNLANIRLSSALKNGDMAKIPCWGPARMKKYRMEAKLVGFESQRLLEINTQDKIQAIADKLVAFCDL